MKTGCDKKKERKDVSIKSENQIDQHRRGRGRKCGSRGTKEGKRGWRRGGGKREEHSLPGWGACLAAQECGALHVRVSLSMALTEEPPWTRADQQADANSCPC